MYKLIGSPKTRAFRVLWMLEEIGADYTIQPDPPRAEAVSKLNPTGKIPVLEVDGTPIIDSVAINQYLADKHGMLTFAAGTLDRARQDSMTQFLCDEIDGTLWTAARNSFILPEEKRVPAIKDTLKWEFERSIKALETRLEGDYLLGEQMTTPDILATHLIRWAVNAKFPVESDALMAHSKRMRSRDAYRRADAIRKG